MRRFIAAAGVVLMGSSAWSESVDSTWIGPSGGLWHVPRHWHSGVVPDNGGGDQHFVTVDGNRRNAALVLLNQSAVVSGLKIGGDDEVQVGTALLLGLGGLENDGLLQLNSVGHTTDLRVEATSEWIGGGLVRFSNTLANRLYGVTGSTRLTVGENLTIDGSAQVGINQLALTNHGLIESNVSSGMVMDLADGETFFNDGVVRATSGSTLQLNSLVIDNTLGVIEAAGGDVVLNGFSIVSGGSLGVDKGGALRNAGVATLDGVTLAGTWTAQTGTLTVLRNDCVLLEPVKLDSAGHTTDLRIDTTPYSMMGVVETTNTLANRVYGATGAHRLVIEPTGVVRGSMQLGINQLALTNHGLIDSNMPGGIVLDLAGDVGNVSDGEIVARSGSTVTFASVGLDNTHGLIKAEDGGVVNFTGSTSLLGGEISSQGSGTLVNAGALTLDAVTLTGALELNTGTLLVLKNDNPLLGPVNSNSVGHTTDIRLDTSPYTLTDGAVVNFSNTQANRMYGVNGSTRLVIPASATVRGSMQLGAAQLSLTNHGSILADVTGGVTMALTPGGEHFNDGLIQASNGALLNMASVTLNNARGVVEALSGSEVSISAATIIGGELRTSGSGVIVNPGGASLNGVTMDAHVVAGTGSATFLHNTVVNDGIFEIASVGHVTDVRGETNPTRLDGSGEMVFTNTIVNRLYGQTGATRIINGAGHTIRGTLQLGVNQSGFTNEGTLRATGSSGITIDVSDTEDFTNLGLLEVSGGNLVVQPGEFINAGELIVEAGRAIVYNSLTPLMQTGGTLLVDGSIELPTDRPVVATGGVVTGHGVVNGDVECDGGRVNPGRDGEAGVLEVGSYTQTADGTLEVDLDGFAPETGYDVLDVAGTAILAGRLNINVGTGYVPLLGDEYVVLDAGSLVGEFELVAPCQGFLVTYDQIESRVIVSVIGSVLPADLNCDLVVDGADLGILLGAWDSDDEAADLDDSGFVDGGDLGLLLGEWTI